MSQKEKKESFTTWVAKRVIVCLAVFVALYFMGLMPQPIGDMISWLSENFTTVAVLFGYSTGFILLIYMLKKSNQRT